MGDKFSKLVFGAAGLLLGVVGYFLSTRDAEVRTTNAAIWSKIGELNTDISAIKIQLEGIKAENGNKLELIKWLSIQADDREKRLRELEKNCTVRR